MFDLEQEIAKWRREMEATGLAPEVLNELEGHLREDIERQMRGVTAQEAFQGARLRMGRPHVLRDEFARAKPGLLAGLLRHKWKVVLCSVAGLLAAAGLYVARPVEYRSEAKLFVRYIISEERATNPTPGAEQRKAPSPAQTRIMVTEAEILQSFDISRRVAASIGPEKILRKAGGGVFLPASFSAREDITRAAVVLRKGLTVTVPPGSSVVNLAFRHPDSEIVQPVLTELVNQYFRMHTEVHRSLLAQPPNTEKVTSIVPIQSPSQAFAYFTTGYQALTMVAPLAGLLAGLLWVLVARFAEERANLAT